MLHLFENRLPHGRGSVRILSRARQPAVIVLVSCFSPLPSREPADWIYTARYVVTMDAQRHLIDDGAVAIRGDRIVGVGQARRHRKAVSGPPPPGPAGRAPDAGLDQHAHARRHVAAARHRRRHEAAGLAQKFIFPAEAKNVTPDFVLWGTRLACLEMMLSGTTTFVDMYYFEDRVAQATKEAGMRGVLGETMLRFKSPDAATPKDALRFTEKFIQQYQDDPLIIPAVAPHAIYTNNDADLRAARQLANKYGVPLVIHLSETKTENDDAAAHTRHDAHALAGLARRSGRPHHRRARRLAG